MPPEKECLPGQFSDPVAKRTMLRIADSYEELAHHAEVRASERQQTLKSNGSKSLWLLALIPASST
jgi:hypothetical protein